MTKIIDDEQISEVLKNGREEAKELLQDSQKTYTVLNELEEKLAQEEELREKIPYVSNMISLIKDYVDHTYTQISDGTVLYVMSGLLYLLYPIDYVPDMLERVGYMDDVMVLSKLHEWVQDDLHAYQESKSESVK